MRKIIAADLMNPEVLTVFADASVREVSAFLLQNEITGAPVADESGNLVGVVSVVDLATAASDESRVAVDRSNPEYFVRGWEDKLSTDEMRMLRVENEAPPVREIMTPEVYTVDQDAPVSEIAELMLDAHIHRVIVTNDGKPVGIVTTSDLLGLLVDSD